MTTVVALLDDGVDYTNPDIYLNIWINQGEIPATLRANLTDADGDGLITFRDLNAPANAAYVSDLNGNGTLDATERRFFRHNEQDRRQAGTGAPVESDISLPQRRKNVSR